MTSIFPEKHYVVGPRAEGWQLVSLNVHKDEVEDAHEHQGGILIHEPVPMDLYCGVKRTVTALLTEKSDKRMSCSTYHLKPSTEYQFTLASPTSFFIVQCAMA